MIRKAAALVLFGLVLLAVAGATGSRALKGPGLIRITDVETAHTVADGSPKGRSIGDVDFRRQTLYNKRVAADPIGHVDIVCTYTGSHSSSCMATYFLPRGEIVAGGVIGSRLFFTIPVLGGTGLYSNARGTLTVTSLGAQPSRELLVFRLET